MSSRFVDVIMEPERQIVKRWHALMSKSGKK